MSAHPITDVDDVDFYFKIQQEEAKAFIHRSDRLAYRIREFKKCLRDLKVSHYFFYPDPGAKGVRKPDKTEVLVGLLDQYLKSQLQFMEHWQLLNRQMETILQGYGVKEQLNEKKQKARLGLQPKKNKDTLAQSLDDWDECKRELNSLQGKLMELEEEARSYVLGLIPPGESIHLILTQWSVNSPPDSWPNDLESLLTLMTAHPMGLRELLKG